MWTGTYPGIRYEIPNSHLKLIRKTKYLEVILNKLSSNTLSNIVDKYI